MSEMQDNFDEFDVNKLRKPWEIEDHWTLRRDFILSHFNKFPLERLLCLAQLFVNIETLGNEYSPEIMQEINELSRDVVSLKEIRQRKKELNKAHDPKLIETQPKRHQTSHYY